MKNIGRIMDISVPLSPQTVVYPGDPKIEIKPFKDLGPGQSRLSKVCFGTHSGTHVDAPAHCTSGKEVHELPLDAFVGPCRVLDFSECAEKISKESLMAKNVKAGERILAKTKNSGQGFETWRDDFVYLDGDAADYLTETGIALFGIDTWSVKQKGSKDNRAHSSLLGRDIPILETIDLSQVSEGEYYLVAAPLKFMGVEGAPVRAILLEV